MAFAAGADGEAATDAEFDTAVEAEGKPEAEEAAPPATERSLEASE
jgi:hypothetical protein